MTYLNTLRKAFAVGLLTAIIAVAAVSGIYIQRVHAYHDPEFRTGIFGVVRGQTARLNVVALGGPDTSPVQVQLQFLDSQGRTLARSTETLMPNHAAFLDLNADFVERVGNRLQVRGVVSRLGDGSNSPPDPDRRRVIVTAEVFDNDTGRTTVFIDNPDL